MSHIGYLNHQARLAEQRANKRKKKQMPFATPSAPSGGLDFKALNGSLLLIDVLSFEDHVPTVHTKPGEKSPAVRANVAVIEGSGAGETYDDTLIFPKLLVSQTKTMTGQKVLGRLGQGQGKPGQSPPWILNEASAEDIAKAEAWVTEHAKPTVTSAAAPF